MFKIGRSRKLRNESGSGTSIQNVFYVTLIGIKVTLCKAVRPGHLVRPKIRLTESGTDLITIMGKKLVYAIQYLVLLAAALALFNETRAQRFLIP
jgi:hypothetical protein